MLTDALTTQDEVIDSEGNEYEVLAASPHEVVLRVLPPNAGLMFFIFERRATDGVWKDREIPDIHLTDFL